MKTTKYLAYAFAPVAIGYLYNLILNSMLGMVWVSFIFYAVPFATTFFWLTVGYRYSKEFSNFFIALVMANFMGIVSLVIFYWQYSLPTESQNGFLSVISRCFSSTMAPYVAGFALKFEPDPSVTTEIFVKWVYTLGTIAMAFVFTIGYAAGRNKDRAIKFILKKGGISSTAKSTDTLPGEDGQGDLAESAVFAGNSIQPDEEK